MNKFYFLLLCCLYGMNAYCQTISASNATGEATIQKSTPQLPSIQSGELFSYTISFQNLNSNNTLVITDNVPAGLCFANSDVRANNAFVDFNGFSIPSPNTIPGLIDTNALPSIVFNIPNNVQSGSFTITVSFCAGSTPNGFTVTNNICGDYTSNGSTENFCPPQGITSTAAAVNPWGRITKEAILPAVSDAAGNTFVQNMNGVANYRIIIEKAPGFQGLTFGMLNLDNVTISEIASPPCAVVTLVSGPGTFNSTTNQIELTDSLLGADPFPFVEFIVEVDYSPCGMLPEGQSLSNRVELNGTPTGGNALTNIANATTIVTATATLPSPEENSFISKNVDARNPVAGCQGRYDLFFFNADNRAIGSYEIIDTMPPGLVPDSYEVIGTISTLSPSGTFDVFINNVFDRSFTLPDDSGFRFPWNGSIGDEIRITAQNNTQIFPGDDVRIGIFFTIDPSLTPGSLVTNCVDLTADLILNNAPNLPTGNESCIDLLIEAPSMDVCINKSVRIADRPDPFNTSITNVVPTDEVEFQICVQNNGSLDFSGTMQDVLDAKYEFVSVDNTNMPAGTTFNQTGQTLTWNNLDLDQTCDVFEYDTGCAITGVFYCATVRARIRPQTPAGNIDNSASLIENTGTVLATSDFAKVNVIESSVFVIRKEVSLDNVTFQSTPLIIDPLCDNTIYYRITAENIGNRAATSFQILDELPAFNDIFFPTSISRNSTFSFENVITTSNDFNFSYLNFTPSSSFGPSSINCSSTVAGDPNFTNGVSRTIRFENIRTLTNNDVFEINMEVTLPSNGLFSNDIAVNSAYAIDCSISSGLIASSSITSPAIIEIQKTVEAGFDVNAGFCSDNPPFPLFNFFNGTADPGGTWTPALTTPGIFDPAVDAPGVYTYTVTAVPSCATDTSEITVTVTPQSDPGQDGSLTLCSTGSAVNLISSLNGTPDNGGTWTPALNSGTGVFDPNMDPAGSYTYTLPGIDFCSPTSSMVTVTINNAANAGNDTVVDLCSSGSQVDLTTLLSGSPDAGGSWFPALVSGTGVFDPSIDLSGVYTYTVSGVAPCNDDSAQFTITITTSPDPGTDGAVSICANANSIDLFNSLTGSPQLGGSWTPALSSGTSIFDPAIDPAGNYTYTLPGLNSCPPSTALVDVTVTPAPDPGTVGIVTLCNSSTPLDLITVLNGTPNSGGVWSPALNSGTGLFDPAIDNPGTYTYTVSRNGCEDESATVVVNFNAAVIIANATDLSECDDMDATNDGLTMFDLTSQESNILNGLDPLIHNITYHISSADALNNTNTINPIYQNTMPVETIFIRVENTITNCFAVTNFTINGLFLPESLLLDQYEACFNENGVPINPSRLPVLDTQLSPNGFSFRWFLDGTEITSSNQSALRVSSLGVYEVEITDLATGCINTDTTTVVPEDMLMAQAQLITNQFNNNPIIIVTVLNDTGNVYEYRLDDGPWQSSNRFENPQDGIRTVYVRGPDSCGIATDTVLVLRYPNYFTPNSDGFHDFWQVENLRDDGNKLYIFDRFGKLLKQLSLEGPGWDGTYNGNPMPSSDYWFSLEYTDPNTGQMDVLKSHFALKR